MKEQDDRLDVVAKNVFDTACLLSGVVGNCRTGFSVPVRGPSAAVVAFCPHLDVLDWIVGRGQWVVAELGRLDDDDDDACGSDGVTRSTVTNPKVADSVVGGEKSLDFRRGKEVEQDVGPRNADQTKRDVPEVRASDFWPNSY